VSERTTRGGGQAVAATTIVLGSVLGVMAIPAGSVILACSAILAGSVRAAEPAGRDLFDGRSFAGWHGDTGPGGTWRIEDDAIVAGSDTAAAARNEFLATDGEWGDFELRLEYRIDGSRALNAGVQFRSRRIPDHHEVIGYQADIGPGLDGALYDESRRRRFLAEPEADVRAQALAAGTDGWHELSIRCEGPRVRIRLNGVQTVDFTETDAEVEPRGMIALQIHGRMVGTIRYRNIHITDLSVPSVGDDAHGRGSDSSP
jgi:hypothetical protein